MGKVKERKAKKCLSNKRTIWWIYSVLGLSFRAMASFSLAIIALNLLPLGEQAGSFNQCIDEVVEEGSSYLSAVNSCNGGAEQDFRIN